MLPPHTTMPHLTLLPCPFCGGEAEIVRHGTPRQSTMYSCTECSCRLESGETRHYGQAWNTRAALANPEDTAGAARTVDASIPWSTSAAAWHLREAERLDAEVRSWSTGTDALATQAKLHRTCAATLQAMV